MFDSIYAGMSGLMAFSKGLSNISNNVANMNTPGFKGSELQFHDLMYRHQYASSEGGGGTPYSDGGGVKAGATVLRHTQGEFRRTGGDLDVAIDGNGFFVLRADGEQFYTRAGQFSIDDDGYLTVSGDGARVAGLQGGALTDISISGKRSSPAQATTRVGFTESLSTGDSSFDVSNIAVFDSLGVEHTLALALVNDSATIPGRWTFTLTEGSNVVTTGEVRYSGSGSPVAGFETHVFSFAPGGGASTTTLTLDFSNSNAFSSSGSSLAVESVNGRASGFLTGTSIDASGHVVLEYSNGATVQHRQLALAAFSNLQALQAQGDNRFVVFGETDMVLGTAGQTGFGSLLTQGIELSNVDLAQEFGELIIVQRAYQASSQVISAANEMMQQLGELKGR